jgi:hypothetical protein
MRTVVLAAVLLAVGTPAPAAASPMALRVATIVISRERRLTRAEMAFFDHFAARGESLVPLPFASGFEKGITRPFALATRGLATLQTDIDCPLPPTGPR